MISRANGRIRVGARGELVAEVLSSLISTGVGTIYFRIHDEYSTVCHSDCRP